MLTDKIYLSTVSTSEPEDIFSSSRSLLFTDDITNQHGDNSSTVLYRSSQFGDLKLELADPRGEEARRLFSHYLWNAGVQLAAFIEESEYEGSGSGSGSSSGLGEEKGEEKGKEKGKEKGEVDWKVRGHSVLELGAGTGLVGIMASLMGAQEVVVTDYPAEEVLANLRVNVDYNCSSSSSSSFSSSSSSSPPPVPPPVPPPLPSPSLPASSASSALKNININVSVQGHSWGQLTDTFSLTHKESFTRVLLADCLWMPWQHGNLLRSIRWFLAREGRAWVVAGFHTGRWDVRGFFEEARVRECGLVVERVWERDVVGNERGWVEDRGVEDKDVVGRKKWLVVGILKRLD